MDPVCAAVSCADMTEKWWQQRETAYFKPSSYDATIEPGFVIVGFLRELWSDMRAVCQCFKKRKRPGNVQIEIYFFNGTVARS